jgi:hypothetical protein
MRICARIRPLLVDRPPRSAAAFSVSGALVYDQPVCLAHRGIMLSCYPAMQSDETLPVDGCLFPKRGAMMPKQQQNVTLDEIVEITGGEIS